MLSNSQIQNNSSIFKKIVLSDLKIGARAGHGTFGDVYIYINRQNGMKYAVKKFSYQDIAVHTTTVRELKALQSFKHKNVIEILSIDVFESKIHAIFPFYSDNLDSHIKSNNPKKHVKGILEQIILGTMHIHSCGYLHRDLKPANIMIEEIVFSESIFDKNENWREGVSDQNRCPFLIKIIDFGMSRKYNKQMTPQVCTLWYRAPEILLGNFYNQKVDVWSIGCIFMHILTGNAIFHSDSEIILLNMIKELCDKNGTDQSNFRKKFCFLSEDTLDLAEKMLIIDPEKRIGLEEALNHPYFKKN